LFVGTYIPLHGIEHILEAASILRSNTAIHFELVGSGQCYREARERAAELALENVTFSPPTPLQALPNKIASANVCLGIFGTSKKAHRVIPNKVYQAMAMGKALITADTEAARILLQHEVNALLVPPGDAASIAQAILRLKDDEDLRARLGSNALRTFHERATPAVLGPLLSAICGEVMRRRSLLH